MILDCISFGVDHFGGDIKCVPAATYIECNAICIKEPKCRRWSLNMLHYHKQCFLKREETENKDDPIGDSCNSFTGFKNSDSKGQITLGLKAHFWLVIQMYDSNYFGFKN